MLLLRGVIFWWNDEITERIITITITIVILMIENEKKMYRLEKYVAVERRPSAWKYEPQSF